MCAKPDTVLGPISTRRRRPANLGITGQARVGHIVYVVAGDDCLSPQWRFHAYDAAFREAAHLSSGVPAIARLHADQPSPGLPQFGLSAVLHIQIGLGSRGHNDFGSLLYAIKGCRPVVPVLD